LRKLLMFYSMFLIFFAPQKYYLMICSGTFIHMAAERKVGRGVGRALIYGCIMTHMLVGLSLRRSKC
jgi:hypothetical protein